MRTFQSRLAAKQNRIAQKLSDNSIGMLGTVTDVFRIKTKKNGMGDLISRTVEDIDVIEIIFPPLKDVPMWRFVGSTSKQSVDIHSKEELKPFKAFAPVSAKVDQDDIVVKFFENPATDEPLILILQVKDVLGTFGARSIIYQQINISYYDEQLEPELITWCMEAANRRKILKW